MYLVRLINHLNKLKTLEDKEMTNTQIDAKVTEIELLEAQIKELKALVDSAKSELKSELDDRKVDMIDTGIHHIFYEVISKKIVDTKSLKADGMYDKYSKESLSTMFKITSVTTD